MSTLDSVNSVNSVNSLSSSSAVLPPSLMVFFHFPPLTPSGSNVIKNDAIKQYLIIFMGRGMGIGRGGEQTGLPNNTFDTTKL